MGVRSRQSVKGAQYGLSIGASAVPLTVPTLANCAEIYVRTAAVVFTKSGTDPTATLGMQAEVGDIIPLNSRDELDKFRAIRAAASATIDVEYFSDLSG